MEGGATFLVMPYVPCELLRTWCAAPRPAWHLQAVLANVAHALAFVHASGAAHRAPSPDTVAVTSTGRALLTSFARVAQLHSCTALPRPRTRRPRPLTAALCGTHAHALSLLLRALILAGNPQTCGR